METQDKQTLLIDLHYLPNLEFFTYLQSFPNIILEANENFIKQTYRNRCYILGANKVEMLTVPVIDGNKKVLIKDLKIDYSQRWNIIHWRTISAAYGKSPFFEFYADYFQNILDKKNTFLWDLNFQMLTTCLKLLKVNRTISHTEVYQKEVDSNVFDARTLFNPKKQVIETSFYLPKPYQQNFGNEFVPNLSIIDLLFCRGTQALEILKNSSLN
ncbi:WbqC family protein [Emticicia oligotrophica]|uniref:WbqC family protein n=2 Tax=Leadbetterellaceae TaxID=3141702 RepID=UPI00273BF245|nr:WbqC family protein [Emticicia oligotrophica]